MSNPEMSAGHAGTLTALFSRRDGAECAYQSAIELGYEKSDINVVMSDETRQRLFPSERVHTELSDKAAESTKGSSKIAAELGGHVGAAIGTIAPALAAIGTLVLIPGITLVGPIAVAVAAAGAVGIAGGLIGVLTNWGIPEDRIHQYETGIRGGGMVLGVKPRSDDDANELVRRWRADGGELIRQ